MQKKSHSLPYGLLSIAMFFLLGTPVFAIMQQTGPVLVQKVSAGLAKIESGTATPSGASCSLSAGTITCGTVTYTTMACSANCSSGLVPQCSAATCSTGPGGMIIYNPPTCSCK